MKANKILTEKEITLLNELRKFYSLQELACMFNVTPQAVLSWQKGKPMAIKNHRKFLKIYKNFIPDQELEALTIEEFQKNLSMFLKTCLSIEEIESIAKFSKKELEKIKEIKERKRNIEKLKLNEEEIKEEYKEKNESLRKIEAFLS